MFATCDCRGRNVGIAKELTVSQFFITACRTDRRPVSQFVIGRCGQDQRVTCVRVVASPKVNDRRQAKYLRSPGFVLTRRRAGFADDQGRFACLIREERELGVEVTVRRQFGEYLYVGGCHTVVPQRAGQHLNCLRKVDRHAGDVKVLDRQE